VAWSVLQSAATAATGSSGTSVSTSFATANLTAGSTIIAAFSAASSSTTPTTPTATCGGVSMVLLAQGTSTGGVGSQTLTALFALNTPAGQVGTQPTVQGQWTHGAFTSMVIEEVSGLITSTTQAGFTDGTPAVKVNTSGTNPATSASYSSTASNEFLIFVYGDDGGPATLGALSTGYSTDTNNVSANSHSDLGIGYKNSGNGSESASWALSGSLAGQVTILTGIQLAPAAPGSSMLPQPGGRAYRRRYRRRQAWPAGANPPITSTGSLDLNMTFAGTGYQGLPFPSGPLGIKVELLINGTWTNISRYVYQRADQVITTGRPDESSQLQQSTCTLTLNNTDFRFSPYNTSGAYYPYLTRNTQCRVSVTALSAGGVLYSGYRFWGEVPAWPPVWDTTGTDITAVVTVSGVMRRLTANTRNIGSALYRYWTRLSGAAAPVAYWPCTDASTAVSFASAVSGGTAMTWTGTPGLAGNSSIAGSDGFANLSGSAWTGSVSGGGPLPSPATYSTPGTYLWECPGDVTSLTSAECWGAGGGSGSGPGTGGGPTPTGFGGGGGGGYSKVTGTTVVPGTQYTLTVGTGGVPGVSGEGGDGTDSSFNTSTVIAKAGTAAHGNTQGKGGQASHGTGTTKRSGGNGGTVPTSDAGGAGGGSSAGTGSDGNDGSNSSGSSGAPGGSAPSGGVKGGNGQNSGVSGAAASAGGGGAGGAGAGSSIGGNGGAGEVKLTYVTSGAPAANIMTFCLDVPSAGGVNGAIYGEMLTSGTIATVDVVYGTGGTLTVTGYNSGHSSKFTHTSAAICNGVPMAVQVSLTQSGTAVAWSFDYITPGAGSPTNISSGSVSSSVIGGAEAFNANPGGTETGAVGVGEVVIQYAASPLADLGSPLAGYAGERAATRLARLCAEANVGFELTGNASDTAQMGPQTDTNITALFQECEDVDKGLLYEPRDLFGLGYRTRVSLQNQSAGATLDYAAFDVGEAVPQPVDDELLVVNDMTFTRPNGSSYESTVMTGALSVLAPPNGVGYYSQAQTFNFYADSQLANATTWATTIGTVDEFRWPVIEVDLRRSELDGALFSAVPGLAIGGFLELVNPPAFVFAVAVKQLIYGYTETLNAFNWTFDFNCVPESPYEGGGLPSW
jgi:hypothetical protein